MYAGMSVNAADWATACHNLHFNPRKLHFFLCRYQRFIHSVCQSVGWLVDFLSDKQQLIKYWIIVSLRCSSPSSSSSSSLPLSCSLSMAKSFSIVAIVVEHNFTVIPIIVGCQQTVWWIKRWDEVVMNDGDESRLATHSHRTHKKIIKAKFKKSGKTILIAKSSWELVQWPQTHCIKICRDGKQ